MQQQWSCSLTFASFSLPNLSSLADQCISYAAEAFIDTAMRFPSAITRDDLSALRPTVEYLLRQQEPSGQLVSNGTQGEIQRSPRAVSFLQLYSMKVSSSEPPGIQDALDRYYSYLGTDKGKEESGLNRFALATGFIGLATADLIQPWVTFSRPRQAISPS